MKTITKDDLCAGLLTAGGISRHQHAFSIKHSTVSNLLKTTYDWIISLNYNNPLDAIYIDFKKSFNSVVITKVLYKLSDIGIAPLLMS